MRRLFHSVGSGAVLVLLAVFLLSGFLWSVFVWWSEVALFAGNLAGICNVIAGWWPESVSPWWALTGLLAGPICSFFLLRQS